MDRKRRERFLIVNADDFGQSHGVNSGIAEAHEHGIVTSASMMVRWPAALEAATYAQAHPELSVGLHLDLGEWAFRDGEWVQIYKVMEDINAGAVADEVEHQLAIFRRLMRRNPTHIDSHQHCHRREPVSSIVLALGHNMGIPVRDFSADVCYTGRFYGQTDHGLPYPEGISVKGLIQVLEDLQPGWTELGCHPAYGRDLDSMYQVEREQELKTLCDRRVREAIAGISIELSSFHRLGRVPSRA
ncbi:MAG: ChbG/HpnK family deacetylase [Acidobacteriota bacterium]